jgi:hypothetical protein
MKLKTGNILMVKQKTSPKRKSKYVLFDVIAILEKRNRAIWFMNIQLTNHKITSQFSIILFTRQLTTGEAGIRDTYILRFEAAPSL